MKEIRKQIDEVDQQIIALLQKRIALAKKTTPYKTKIIDEKREREVFEKWKGLEKIAKAIIQTCRDVQ